MNNFKLNRSLKSFVLYFTSQKKQNKPTPVPTAKTAKRSYSGARASRLESDWVVSSTSVDAELQGALRRLRDRSREQIRNNDYVRGAVQTLVNNVVGNGIRFQANVGKGKGFSDRRNQIIEDKFAEWSKPKNCDIAEKLSWCQMQRLIFRSLVESGEVFIRKHYPRRPGVPFCLEIIESDRIEDNYGYSPQSSPTGNLVKMGIELDKYGKALFYYLRPFHPGDLMFHPRSTANNGPYGLERVPADQMIHLFISDRPGQTRGIPWVSSSLQRIRNLNGYEEAELIAARASASVMGFRVTKDVDLLERDEAGNPIDSLEPGTIKELAPGEEFVGFDPSRPNDAFEPFVHMMLRGLAANLGIDFESISRDYSQSNYSSSRLALLQVRDTYQHLQKWFIEYFLQPVFDEWLNTAILSGELKFSDYELNPDRYRNVRWRPRGWTWVDPYKETQASIAAIGAGLSTLTSELAKQGLDVEEVMLERAAELQLAEDLGLIPPAEEELEDSEEVREFASPQEFNQFLKEIMQKGMEDDDDPNWD